MNLFALALLCPTLDHYNVLQINYGVIQVYYLHPKPQEF